MVANAVSDESSNLLKMENAGAKSVAEKIFEASITLIDLLIFIVRFSLQFLYGCYECIVPPKEKNVAGEIVLITGAGHGIGKELAKQYGDLGAEIVCVDINTANNEATVKELRKSGVKAHAYTCDVCNREKVLELAEKVQKEVGDVTILVNNAGIMPCKKFLSHSPQEIRKMMDVNVFAHFWTLEAFLPTMMKNDKGHVVGISSIAGLVGTQNVAPYSASKYAVRGLMEGISEELRASNHQNIKFTTIYPYITDTGLCKKPRIKFQNFMKILTPQQTASIIIESQRRGYKESTAPKYLLYTNNFTRLLPWSCTKLFLDFLDAKLDEHDEGGK